MLLLTTADFQQPPMFMRNDQESSMSHKNAKVRWQALSPSLPTSQKRARLWKKAVVARVRAHSTARAAAQRGDAVQK